VAGLAFYELRHSGHVDFTLHLRMRWIGRWVVSLARVTLQLNEICPNCRSLMRDRRREVLLTLCTNKSKTSRYIGFVNTHASEICIYIQT
jgi:hypothetical protein